MRTYCRDCSTRLVIDQSALTLFELGCTKHLWHRLATGVSEAFKRDTNDLKLNLGVGAYRTEELKPYVLNVVKKVNVSMGLRHMHVYSLAPHSRSEHACHVAHVPMFSCALAALSMPDPAEAVCHVMSRHAWYAGCRLRRI